jgi:hypothetical protein
MIDVTMTDRDTIEHVYALTGVGVLGSVIPQQSHHKAAWKWRVSGERALTLMLLVRPFLSERRMMKVNEILQQCGEKPVEGFCSALSAAESLYGGPLQAVERRPGG